jgi:hypothetical protein
MDGMNAESLAAVHNDFRALVSRIERLIYARSARYTFQHRWRERWFFTPHTSGVLLIPRWRIGATFVAGKRRGFMVFPKYAEPDSSRFRDCVHGLGGVDFPQVFIPPVLLRSVIKKKRARHFWRARDE